MCCVRWKMHLLAVFERRGHVSFPPHDAGDVLEFPLVRRLGIVKSQRAHEGYSAAMVRSHPAQLLLIRAEHLERELLQRLCPRNIAAAIAVVTHLRLFVECFDVDSTVSTSEKHHCCHRTCHVHSSVCGVLWCRFHGIYIRSHAHGLDS